MYRHIWAEINLDAIRNNIDQILKLVPADKIMGVIKANAYGHGAGIYCDILREKGVKNFAVSNVYEALDLRTKGTDFDILILGKTDPSAAKEIYKNNITLCVYDLNSAAVLSDMAKKENLVLNCHIKLDTGMGRLGFNTNDQNRLEEEIKKVFELDGLNITGAFTHFASADRDRDKQGKFMKYQYDLFRKSCDIVSKVAKAKGKDLLKFHSSNSAATILDFENCPSDFYRAGIILYGLTPSTDLKHSLKLMPVMSLKATVSQVKTIKKGKTISYGRTFTAKKEMKVATITAGYADGYSRSFSNNGYVLINGKKARILGRVCMDQTVVDVSGIEGVFPGDIVTLFGKGLPVEELAKKSGTINYEIVCNVAHRVPRVLIENGEEKAVVRYSCL